jgi:predicted nucleic acid-binding protein
MAKPLLILDSSPLITLALFPVHKPALETVAIIADLIVVETVAIETTAYLHHRDAVIIKNFLDSAAITRLPVPSTPVDAFIDAYSKLDAGERDTIRLALTIPKAQVILDDTAAFIAATNFELKPIMLLNLLVAWANDRLLDTVEALQIVDAVALRYSEAFVNHIKYKLGEE